MLFRRRVITPAAPATEREVVVVRPRRPASLYAALGVATLCAVGLIGYMTYALYNDGRMEPEPTTTAVIIDDRPTNGRAQRIERTNKPPQTIIVNPPPVYHVTPPAPNPPPVRQQDTPIIVNGAPQTETAPARPRNRTEDEPPVDPAPDQTDDSDETQTDSE